MTSNQDRADRARLGSGAGRRRRGLRDPAREGQRRGRVRARRHHQVALRHGLHRRRRERGRARRRPDLHLPRAPLRHTRAVSRAATRRWSPPPSPSPTCPTACRSIRTCRAARCSPGSRARRTPCRATPIYRCPTMAGPWERVIFVEGRLNTVYEDTVPGDLRVMYYRIAAVNRFGGESEPTEQPIRAVTKAEPLPPIGLEASASSLGRADLRWAPNVEPDLASYEVWRALANGVGLRRGGRRSRRSPRAPRRSRTSRSAAARARAIACARPTPTRSSACSSDAARREGRRTPGWRLARRDGGSVLSWDPARAGDWTGVRVSEVRGALPDREVASRRGGKRDRHCRTCARDARSGYVSAGGRTRGMRRWRPPLPASSSPDT